VEPNDLLTDADRIRVLANPIRYELLEYVTIHERVTATECARALHRTVNLCSYHLHVLANHGFLEARKDRDARKTLWEPRQGAFRLDPTQLESEPAQGAFDDLAATMFRRGIQLAQQYTAARRTYSLAWQQAPAYVNRIATLSPERLLALQAELTAIIDSYATNRMDDDPSATQVHLAFLAIPYSPPSRGRA